MLRNIHLIYGKIYMINFYTELHKNKIEKEEKVTG